MAEPKTYTFGNKEPVAPREYVPDVPQVETKIKAILSKKNGQPFIVHQTIITSIHPVTYYEKCVQSAVSRATQAK